MWEETMSAGGTSWCSLRVLYPLFVCTWVYIAIITEFFKLANPAPSRHCTMIS